MNGIQLRKKTRRTFNKAAQISGRFKCRLLQRLEQHVHLPGDEFWIAKHTSAFSHPDCPVPARPVIHVLKQVAMESTVMTWCKPTFRHRLFRTQSDLLGFKGCQ